MYVFPQLSSWVLRDPAHAVKVSCSLFSREHYQLPSDMVSCHGRTRVFTLTAMNTSALTRSLLQSSYTTHIVCYQLDGFRHHIFSIQTHCWNHLPHTSWNLPSCYDYMLNVVYLSCLLGLCVGSSDFCGT